MCAKETLGVWNMDEIDGKLSAALIECAKGDKSAFNFIYKETSPVLLSMIRRIVKDEDLARDILQRGYVKVWRKAPSYEDKRGRAFTWILVIMRNQAIDEWRRQVRFRSTVEITDDIEDKTRSPEAETELAVVRTKIEEALDGLPPKVAFVIRRKYLNGLTSEEIATEIAVSANTVRSWLKRGLEKMKRHFPADSLELAITSA